MSETLEVTYRNHRGEVRVRRIVPLGVYFGSTQWHPEPQWLLNAIDAETNTTKQFALKDFLGTPHVPSSSCKGQKCPCGEPAARKVGEEEMWDRPIAGHNLTSYICEECFWWLMGPSRTSLNKHGPEVEIGTLAAGSRFEYGGEEWRIDSWQSIEGSDMRLALLSQPGVTMSLTSRTMVRPVVENMKEVDRA